MSISYYNTFAKNSKFSCPYIALNSAGTVYYDTVNKKLYVGSDEAITLSTANDLYFLNDLLRMYDNSGSLYQYWNNNNYLIVDDTGNVRIPDAKTLTTRFPNILNTLYIKNQTTSSDYTAIIDGGNYVDFLWGGKQVFRFTGASDTLMLGGVGIIDFKNANKLIGTNFELFGDGASNSLYVYTDTENGNNIIYEQTEVANVNIFNNLHKLNGSTVGSIKGYMDTTDYVYDITIGSSEYKFTENNLLLDNINVTKLETADGLEITGNDIRYNDTDYIVFDSSNGDVLNVNVATNFTAGISTNGVTTVNPTDEEYPEINMIEFEASELDGAASINMIRSEIDGENIFGQTSDGQLLGSIKFNSIDGSGIVENGVISTVYKTLGSELNIDVDGVNCLKLLAAKPDIAVSDTTTATEWLDQITSALVTLGLITFTDTRS